MIDDTERPFLAISLDTYNKKEYLIYHNGKENVSEIRQLGKLLFDFSELQDEKPTAAYLSDVKIPALLTDDFLEKQRHLSFNEMHRYSSYIILKDYPDDNEKSKLTAFYIQNRLYMATQGNFKSLFQYYLDELYSDGLFPRKCKRCGSLILARTNYFDILCFACRKDAVAEKTIRYKENHNDEYEALYIKVYQRWYTRIRRAKAKGQLTDDKLKICNDIFSRFSSESCIKRSSVKNGDMSAYEFEEWIASFENQLMSQFQSSNINISNYCGIEKR